MTVIIQYGSGIPSGRAYQLLLFAAVCIIRWWRHRSSSVSGLSDDQICTCWGAVIIICKFSMKTKLKFEYVRQSCQYSTNCISCAALSCSVPACWCILYWPDSSRAWDCSPAYEVGVSSPFPISRVCLSHSFQACDLSTDVSIRGYQVTNDRCWEWNVFSHSFPILIGGALLHFNALQLQIEWLKRFQCPGSDFASGTQTDNIKYWNLQKKNTTD